MVKYIESIFVFAGFWIILFIGHQGLDSAVFYRHVVPFAFVVLGFLLWWSTLVRCYRDKVRSGKLFFRLLRYFVLHGLVAGAVYYKYPRQFFRAVDAVKLLLVEADFPPVVWVGLSLTLIVALALPFLLSSFVEHLLKEKTQKIFISHQEKIATFLNEEESVKKAFLAYEGRSLLWCLLFKRTVLVLWTDARVIIVSESRDKRIPAHIRVMTLLSMRAVRARDPFFSPFGILVEIELLNRLREPLWPLSRVLGEDMAEALAESVQQLKVMQGVYDGPVMNHLCPFCFADAGKGKASQAQCPVCGRSLRESFLQILASKSGMVIPLLLILAFSVNAIRPRICGISRAANGNRIILDSDRIRNFDSSGNVVSSALLPEGIRGHGRFVRTLNSFGTVTGGKSTVYKWANGKLSEIVSLKDKTIVSVDLYNGNALAVVSRKADEWYVSIVSFSGKVKKEAQLSCLIDKPSQFIGCWGDDLLFAMKGGGVARYLVKGSRAGWFVEPVDTGIILDGVIFHSGLVGLVDLERLSSWSVSSERADILFSLDSDGVITNQLSLGEHKLLPRFLNLIIEGPSDTIRPDLICRGSGNDIWMLDIYTGRLVRVTEQGQIHSEFNKGRMAQWIQETRAWMAFSLWAILLAVIFGLLSVTNKVYRKVKG